MPIEIYTGQPGNGKTALMMERLLAEAAKGERPIYAAGIDGLQPGLATILDDPRDWKSVPVGSLIFVDEAWKWFGHLHDATRQSTPKHVLDLAEHRHQGIDFVWTLQQPNQIYPFVRGLIGGHHHVVRRFGTKFIDVFSWGELNEDIKSASKRELALRKTRLLPSQSFCAYKSAEVHTIKARIPFKVMAIPGLLVVACIAAWYGYSLLKPDAFAENLTGKKQTDAALAASAAIPVGASHDAKPAKAWESSTDYARDHLPRFGVMPWTAPVFDGRSAASDPQLYCMSSTGGNDANGRHVEPSCTCLTEQGTRYQLSQPECRTVARHGMEYNPYRERKEQRQEIASVPLQPERVQPSGPVAHHAIPGKVSEVVGSGNKL